MPLFRATCTESIHPPNGSAPAPSPKQTARSRRRWPSDGLDEAERARQGGDHHGPSPATAVDRQFGSRLGTSRSSFASLSLALIPFPGLLFTAIVTDDVVFPASPRPLLVASVKSQRRLTVGRGPEHCRARSAGSIERSTAELRSPRRRVPGAGACAPEALGEPPFTHAGPRREAASRRLAGRHSAATIATAS